MRNRKGENGCTCTSTSGRHWFGCPVHLRAKAAQQKQLDARAAIRRAEGARLWKLRVERGLTRAQLLPVVGIRHRAHLSMMEKGETLIHPRVRAWVEANEGKGERG